MIIGEVSSSMEAVIPVSILDDKGVTQTLNAIIDTGFSGLLSLSPATITSLQLTFSESRVFYLGDNTEVSFDLYDAVVVWDGQERDILVLASDAHPLVGMSMLKGYRITIYAIDGGEVLIKRRV